MRTISTIICSSEKTQLYHPLYNNTTVSFDHLTCSVQSRESNRHPSFTIAPLAVEPQGQRGPIFGILGGGDILFSTQGQQ